MIPHLSLCQVLSISFIALATIYVSVDLISNSSEIAQNISLQRNKIEVNTYMSNRNKYIISAAAAVGYVASAYYYPAETFIASTLGWLIVIPVAFVIYMGYGYAKYVKERKNRITVEVVPSEAMRAIARREEQLNREKEALIQETYHK